FDQIVILGNTLPHLTTIAGLKHAISGIGRSLSAGGHLIMQTVNPGALANKSVHLLPPKLAQGTLFTPFYVNRGKCWEFVMPIYKMVNEAIATESAAMTMLRFWTREELAAIGKSYKFELRQSFGDGGLGVYKPGSSSNLILVFRKNVNA
ncbi:MAG: hypothetical protein WBP29_06485, partial [Candidatus Zixiibacteriota bacterium]